MFSYIIETDHKRNGGLDDEKKAEQSKAVGWSLGSLALLALALKAGWVLYSKNTSITMQR